MRTKNLPRLGVVSREAWACLAVALVRSRRLPALIAVLNLIPAGRVTAQTFTTLYSFTGRGPQWAGLITNSSGNTLYGTTASGGSGGFGGSGTVFAVDTDGTGFTILHNFTALAGPSIPTNSDGANPVAELVLAGNTLYGTSVNGGSS